MIYKLEINQLVLKLHIGVESYERTIPQDIEFNLIISFANLPTSCTSDDIKDALCYASIVDVIEQFCKDKEFHLIEHLGFSLYQHLRNNSLNSEDKLSLKICKKPPLKSIAGNCCFVIN